MIGLIELPATVELSQYVQPIRLSTECGDDLENIDVIVLGNGLTALIGPRQDRIVRRADFTTMSSEACEDRMTKYDGNFSVICVEPTRNQTVCVGDAGKGTTALFFLRRKTPYELSNIRKLIENKLYYFRWPIASTIKWLIDWSYFIQ